MADPARTEIEDSAAGGEVVLVVCPEERDCVIVNVRDEARGGVEGRIWRRVGASEVRRSVGERAVPRGVGAGGEGGRWRRGRGCSHGREESGDGEGEQRKRPAEWGKREMHGCWERSEDRRR